MSDGDGDGIYEYTATLPANVSYEYKFVNGNDWGMDESVPSACGQNGNRVLDVGTADIVLDPVCYASCGICAGVYSVTFRVDMNEETVSPNGVHIAGSFQNWDPGATAMSDGNGDGVYEVTVDLNGNNIYQYKFINGNAWGDDESVPSACALDNNRFLDLGIGTVVTDPFGFGSCEQCLVSTIDLALDKSLFVSPNPSRGLVHLNFNYEGQGTVHVKCFNVLSQVVLSDQFDVVSGKNNIAVSIKDKGIFILSIETEKGIATRRVVIE
jgi:hypothetical protein